MATTVSSTTAKKTAEACARFLESLSADQRAKATFHYMDGERIFWYYPPLNRHGLALRDMDANQRKLAYGILEAGLTPESYQKAKLIIDLETILGPLEVEQKAVTFERDPALYYFTVFGEPGGEDPWAWRAEGHHISLHFSIWSDKVISMTPFFFGSNPAEVRNGPSNGQRILGAREDLAFELMNSLDSGQRSRAIIYEESPWDNPTYNSSRFMLPREEGVPASKMTPTQKEILRSLVTEYVGQVPADVAEDKLMKLNEGGFDRLNLAWGGPVEKGEGHYYRIHGGDFLVEFNNRQNGANHIHSVWRDWTNDFAHDVMEEHRLLYHVL